MVASKPPDWLVAAILDPEQAVEARFAPWTVELKTGDEISGILAAETANNIVVRVAGGADHAVLRSDIQSMTRGSLSLMPSGFESGLQPQDMADLLSWLRGE
jgi:putative heme-binding domain-containing protein